MRDCIENGVIDRLFNERSESFEKFVTEVVSETEKEVLSDIESKLRQKIDDSDALVDLLDNIALLCNLNCKAYYKIGIVDGIKLHQELQSLSRNLDINN